MNILFLGPYRSSSGWGKAAQEYLQALLLTGNNIASKPVYMCNALEKEIHPTLLETENKTLDKPDVIIQNVLPDLLEWHEGYNIGIFDTETWNLKNSIWIDKINLMDEVWVDSLTEADNLKNSGVTCKITPMPVPVNTKNIDKYLSVDKLAINEAECKYIFYFIGEHNDRKNIMAFVQAFHREFAPEENVGILIKTNSPQLKDEINHFKKTSRTRRNYIPEFIIADTIPEKDIYSIHQTCHCFVLTSRGESQCRPIADALYFGNDVICPTWIFADSVFHSDDAVTNEVATNQVPIYTDTPPLPHIYTGKETWHEVDILCLEEAMRDIFTKHSIKTNSAGKKFVQDNLSREAIAERMKECLSSVI